MTTDLPFLSSCCLTLSSSPKETAASRSLSVPKTEALICLATSSNVRPLELFNTSKTFSLDAVNKVWRTKSVLRNKSSPTNNLQNISVKKIFKSPLCTFEALNPSIKFMMPWGTSCLTRVEHSVPITFCSGLRVWLAPLPLLVSCSLTSPFATHFDKLLTTVQDPSDALESSRLILWAGLSGGLLKISPSCLQKWFRGKPTTLRKSPCTYSTSMPPNAWIP